MSRTDAALTTAERKRHGIYYTPVQVVRYLLAATAPRGPVADISCGDGAFLEEAARAGFAVMGVDQDVAALAHARAALDAIPGARHHLLHGDGLAPALPETPDVVLGNPPYLEAKKADAALKARCRALFPSIAKGGFDAFVFFIKAGLDALPPGGRLGYIVPNKFLIAEYARPLREHLLAETTILELVDVSDLPTFRDAAVYPILLVLRKTPPPPGHQVEVTHVTDLAQLESKIPNPKSQIAQAAWASTGRRVFWLPPLEATARTLVDRLLADPASVRLGDLLDIRWTVSFHRSGLRDAFVFPQPTGANPRKLLGGMRFHGNGDVRRYRTDWSGWWIDYDEPRAKAERTQFPPAALFDGPKLVIAQNARRITATLDREGYVCKDTFLAGVPPNPQPLPSREGEHQHGETSVLDLAFPCGGINPKSKIQNLESPVLLLALLNSTLLSYIYGVVFKATHVAGGYLHYLACYLEDLPIRLPDDTAPIVALAERLLDPALSDDDRSALDAALDELIFDLYDLTPEERALVLAAVPPTGEVTRARRGNWRAADHVG
jgi:hypothetical protein